MKPFAVKIRARNINMNIHDINIPLSMFQGFENTWSKSCPKLIDLFALP